MHVIINRPNADPNDYNDMQFFELNGHKQLEDFCFEFCLLELGESPSDLIFTVEARQTAITQLQEDKEKLILETMMQYL